MYCYRKEQDRIMRNCYIVFIFLNKCAMNNLMTNTSTTFILHTLRKFKKLCKTILCKVLWIYDLEWYLDYRNTYYEWFPKVKVLNRKDFVRVNLFKKKDYFLERISLMEDFIKYLELTVLEYKSYIKEDESSANK
jgi:hypothetical protein